MNTCANSSLNAISQCPSLVDVLLYRAQTQPDRHAYTFLRAGETESGALTYQELDQQARSIALHLQFLEATGERALLLYPPGLDFIAAFLGCLYAGVVAVPAYPPRPNQSLTRLQAITTDAQATVVLTTTTLLSSIERWLTQEPELAAMHWLTTDNLTDHQGGEWQRPDISSDSLAFLQYTSGSTGNPKGVMVSHGNLMHNSAAIHHCFGHTPHSQGMIWLPPYHDMGLIGGVLQPLYGGFPVVLMSPVDFLQKPVRWLQAISRYRATTSGGPNFAYDLCVRKVKPEHLQDLDLSSWELAFTGAEPVRAETIDLFVQTFAPYGFRREAFYPCYGMAETTLIVSGGEKSAAPVIQPVDSTALEQNQVIAGQGKDTDRSLVGCGHCVDHQQLVIVDPKTLTRCSDRQVGEVWVSGASVAQGYWNNPEQTAQMFHARLAETGEEPFLRTGDLGFLDQGELFITGRLKDVLIIRGQNHYPQDIEFTVENSHPALRPGCGAAFAAEIKGAERLVIVQEVERSYIRKLDVREIVGNIRQAVAAQHDLQVYAAILVKTGSIPKTSSGKVRRYACKNAFLDGSLNVVEDWSENPQCKTEFLHIQAEVASMLNHLSTGKS